MTEQLTTAKPRERKAGTVTVTDLEPRERLFISFYLQSLNGADAARRAGYVGNCYAHAHRLLNVPVIKAAVEKGYAALAPSPREIIARISAQARASIFDVIDVDESGGFRINAKKALEAGKMGIIKRLTYNSDGQPELEMVDSQAALMHLAKILGMLVDKHIFSGPDDGPIQIDQVRGAMDMLMANPVTMAEAIALADKLTQKKIGDDSQIIVENQSPSMPG